MLEPASTLSLFSTLITLCQWNKSLENLFVVSHYALRGKGTHRYATTRLCYAFLRESVVFQHPPFYDEVIGFCLSQNHCRFIGFDSAAFLTTSMTGFSIDRGYS
jgi:hypothetical protein